MALRAKWAGSRLLLRRLRDTMARGGGAQERLDQIVKIIAADMVAEVCSLYVRRGGDILELFATKGLKPEAVHKVRFRFGDGIVGVVAATARPLALAEAQKHPAFAYRPETGEEIYSSMLGVPILRAGRLSGVLAIQNRTEREYTEEEIETLETVGMVIAEALASGEAIQQIGADIADGMAVESLRLEGVRMSEGLAMGIAVLHTGPLPITDPIAEDEDVELERLDRALGSMHSALDDLIESYRVEKSSGDLEEHLEVLEAYRMVASDRGWIKRIREAIGTGLTAEASVAKVKGDMQARMDAVQDAYLRDRLSDFDALANRLLQHLAVDQAGANTEVNDGQIPLVEIPPNSVLVARRLGPADLLDYDLNHLQAVIVEEGAPTSHVAIVARALNIPMVGHLPGIMGKVDPQDEILVEASNATCVIRPTQEFKTNFEASMTLHKARQEAFLRDRDLPSVTTDAVKIDLKINAGLLIDVTHLESGGAAGIGLYRTEIPFMIHSEFPDIEAQETLYRKVNEQVGDKPVVFRTLDIGSDKMPSFVRPPPEENPALGWRAIRIGLDRQPILQDQCVALLRAAAGRHLSVMFPMVSDVGEYKTAQGILMAEYDRLAQGGEPVPDKLALGVMLEVPALAMQLDWLLPHVDFISIGTNDLLQFFFAADRGNSLVDGRYDPLSPAFLRFLRRIIYECDQANVPVSVCGEMAGNTLDALGLIGVGCRSLSTSPAATGSIRALVRSLSVNQVTEFVSSRLNADVRSIRSALRDFAADNQIQI